MFELTHKGEDPGEELFCARCERGTEIALKLFSISRLPLGSVASTNTGTGEDIPLNARIVLLSQVIEVFHAAPPCARFVTSSR